MKKIWLISLGVILILLIGVGTVGGSRLTASPDLNLITREANSISLDQPAQPAEVNIKQESPFLNMEFLQEEGSPEASLTVTNGEVFTCGDCFVNQECAWIEGQENVQEGSSIRTGADGEVTIQFGKEVELTLAANTQIKINKYQMLDENTVQIHIEHLIGEVFFQVNYSNDDSLTVDFKLISPLSVFEADEEENNTAFSGVSVVSFPNFYSLTPLELEAEISEAPAFNEGCGAFCVDQNCNNCQNFFELGPVDYVLTDNTGQLLVSYFTVDGLQTVTLIAGEEFEYEFQGFNARGNWVSLCQALNAIANGKTPGNVGGFGPGGPTTGPKANCGDGVCNIYDKENKNNCPQDCN